MNALHNPGKPVTLELDGLVITGFAISALASYVMVPSYDAIFDIGHCPKEALSLRHVFLSHVHHDHVGGLYRYLTLRQMRGMSAPCVTVPAESADDLLAMIAATARLDRSDPPPMLLHRLSHGDTLTLTPRLNVRCFNIDHVLPSLGYAVMGTKKRLKPEFHNLSGAEIRKLKEQGTTIDECATTDEFVYIGDSTVATLAEYGNWLCFAKRVLIECTHFNDVDAELSSKVYGHTPLEHLLAVARTQPASNVFGAGHVVLKHFSMRYAREDILAILDQFPVNVRERLRLLI